MDKFLLLRQKENQQQVLNRMGMECHNIYYCTAIDILISIKIN